MDQTSQDPRLTGADAAEGTELATGALRCAICRKRLSGQVVYLEETGDVPEPRQSWMLCEICNEAVKRQMARTRIRTPLRLRVAIGLVAAERTPEARRAHMGHVGENGFLWFLFWGLMIFMLIHLALIVAIAALFH